MSTVVTNVPKSLLELPIEFEPPVRVVRTNNNVPDVDSLTEEQRIAYEILIRYLSKTLTIDYLNDVLPEHGFTDIEEIRMIVLKGYAGTGKTYLITQVLKYFVLMMQANIAVTAPTNKAVKVLKSTADFMHSLINYSTIHKLYGLKEIIDEETGKVTFGPEFGAENDIDDTVALALDEVSMLQDEIFHMIETSTRRTVKRTDESVPMVGTDIDSFLDRMSGKANVIEDNLKVIFLGDPIQIPPIGKSGCIPFNPANSDIYGLLTISLNNIIRQKEGNPILELATIIRNNHSSGYLPYKRESVINNIGASVFINAKDKDVLYRICEVYFTNARFKYDSDFMKVIAWTNKTVNFMNDKIRSFVYKETLDRLTEEALQQAQVGLFVVSDEEVDKIKKSVKLPRILIGEKLIANKPITEDIDFRVVSLFQTNDEFEVVEYDQKVVNVMKDYDVMVYRAKVRYYNTNTNKYDFKTIDIVHEESQERFAQVCAATKKAALNAPKEARGQMWKFHFMIERKFANIAYNYAITSHKAQGSTYDNCIVIFADMDNNKKITERNSIKYVAVTRAKTNLFIVE